MTASRTIPNTRDLYGPPCCAYCEGEGGDDQWMRLVWHDGDLYHDGCIGDLEADKHAHG